jgi:hypothetical protein
MPASMQSWVLAGGGVLVGQETLMGQATQHYMQSRLQHKATLSRLLCSWHLITDQGRGASCKKCSACLA